MYVCVCVCAYVFNNIDLHVYLDLKKFIVRNVEKRKQSKKKNNN